MTPSYKVSLTIQSGQVTGTVSNVVGLIYHTFAPWKSVGNGGHIVNSDTNAFGTSIPADFAVYADSGLTTLLPFELNRWDASTGFVYGWVQIPSAATSTVVWVAYGDAGQTTSLADPPNTWNDDYTEVYHLDVLQSSGPVVFYASSISAFQSLVVNVASAGNARIDNGSELTGASTSYLFRSGASTPTPPFAFSMWIYPDVVDGSAPMPFSTSYYGNSTGATYYAAATYDNGGGPNFAVFAQNASGNTFSSMSFAGASVWSQVYAQFASNSHRQGFVDGVPGSSDTASFTPGTDPDTSWGGAVGNYGGAFNSYDGKLDEIRIHSTTRSDDYIEADYNTQNDPTSFWVLGSETPVGGALLSRLMLLGAG